MSTTGRKDDAGDPGSSGFWKHGFNLECGLPGTLLTDRLSTGPWAIVENTRATKNRLYVVRIAGQRISLNDVMDGKANVAWIGSDASLARTLIERFNGWEMGLEFPPQTAGFHDYGCCRHLIRYENLCRCGCQHNRAKPVLPCYGYGCCEGAPK